MCKEVRGGVRAVDSGLLVGAAYRLEVVYAGLVDVLVKDLCCSCGRIGQSCDGRNVESGIGRSVGVAA